MMNTPIKQDIQNTCKELALLRVPELKSVCRSVGLPLSGRKADLQQRVKEYVENSLRPGHIDPFRPKAILALVQKSKLGDVLPTYDSILQSLKTGAFKHPVATGHVPPSSLYSYKSETQTSAKNENPSPPSILNGADGSPLTSVFYPSPFYTLKRMITGSPKMASKSPGRGTCMFTFRLNEAEKKLLQDSPDTRLYLFCGAISHGNRVHVQFPHPNEIKLNDNLIKDNVRGLKNKVGTAKPADLTKFVRHDKDNYLQLVYAFTKEDYLVYLYLVTLNSPEKILEGILARPKIVRPFTLAYIKKILSEDEDEDLITTSTVLTLQCPISYARMKYPVKSVNCDHLQCFDAMSFILSQMQIPTWQCPVCQKSVSINDLSICEFVSDIIKTADKDVEQVEIHRDGTWIAKEEDTDEMQQKSSDSSESDLKFKVNGENVDELVLDDDIPAPKGKTSTEPIVISLDSDDDELPLNMAAGNNRPMSNLVNVRPISISSESNNGATRPNYPSTTSEPPQPINMTENSPRLPGSYNASIQSQPHAQTNNNLNGTYLLGMAKNKSSVQTSVSGIADHPNKAGTLPSILQENINTPTDVGTTVRPNVNLQNGISKTVSGTATSRSISSLNPVLLLPNGSHNSATTSNGLVAVDPVASSRNAHATNNTHTMRTAIAPTQVQDSGTMVKPNIRLNLEEDRSILFGEDSTIGAKKLPTTNFVPTKSNNETPTNYKEESNTTMYAESESDSGKVSDMPFNKIGAFKSRDNVIDNHSREQANDGSAESITSKSDGKLSTTSSVIDRRLPKVPQGADSIAGGWKTLPSPPSWVTYAEKTHTEFEKENPTVKLSGISHYNPQNNNSRHPKPPVSPFIPKKYSSIIPKKRVISNAEPTTNFDRVNAAVGNPQNQTGPN
ncbi:HHL261Cp [Eremothecium sinecaudum]|uniref:HHL261Cp n=1 Tax=Eremothecium sinecaudum TaxID=45286 RepID=A0A0X8HW37_9SACH|nr:HHL261Cp [Eremothecium sinecaudum]AMD22509.1 HHL261Cp [Eremothecium sinecaudum]